MPPLSRHRITLAAALAALAASVACAGTASAAQQLFPDLKTLPPRNLHLGYADVAYDGGGPVHHVLRFSNTVWNAGAGTLQLHGRIDPSTHRGAAYQRVYDSAGGHVDYPVGSSFYYHPAHHHYHFDDWGRYELWKRADYQRWIAGGRASPAVSLNGNKTSSCALDEEFVAELGSTPAYGRFPADGCSPNSHGDLTEGLAPGWGDTYDYTRFDQWIDLGSSALPDGDYVLRSVTDPLNRVYESSGRSNSARESQQDNEAVTSLSVRGGELADLSAPTGTVQINDVDRRTATSRVRLSVMGRDDVSGVANFRVSNDGRSWSTYGYTADDSGSDRQTIAWDLADGRYGGSPGTGVRKVLVEFRDRAGRWGPAASDTILEEACSMSTGVASGYANSVLADSPVSYWRLGETCGARAEDARGINPGAYVGGPRLGSPGLLADERGSTGVTLAGHGQWIRVEPSSSLDLSRHLSLEAWFRPRAFPRRGHFASILSRAGSYSLQFSGSRLELTLIRGRARSRIHAPAGSVRAGRAYHVVGTFDGRVGRLYLNGRRVAAARAGPPGHTSGPLFLGAWTEGFEMFSGTLDEVAVYPTTLSSARIAAHHRAATPPPAIPSPSNLRAGAHGRAVRLTWADDASRETGLVLERSRDRRFRHVSRRRLRAHLTGVDDVHVSPATVYWYRLRAVAGRHSSSWSAAARAATRRR